MTPNATPEIELLPALPQAWPDGTVTGLRARGGFEVDVAWAQGKLVSARIKSVPRGNKTVIVRYGDQTSEIALKPGGEVWLNSGLQRASQ